ncbi:MAG TPA: hypothetical protein DCE48_13290 [Lachnospiraceae bacterium]|uniref:hypothetical protein n=1 Tax=Anaerosporobacter sp. TaxID=1872529 RepID=UPI000EED8918|nr:hypothetical protein [Anaerosporobacter sp.]HAB61644.1 hypothetical protein [Lachnospiraceae bacterium]
MNDKQAILIEEYIALIPERFRKLFNELAEYAVYLGYNPIRNKTQDLTIDFKKNKYKATIMKFGLKEPKHDGFGCGERDNPDLRLRFFACEGYSEIFQNGIKHVIEEFDGKYTGCYGCGRCKGGLEGYTYIYPDGRKVFRCGRELIAIVDYDETVIEEIKKLMIEQDDFYRDKFGKVKYY